jgi:hypothetical protein
MHHKLKLLSQFFDPKAQGIKPWEIRSTRDRAFNVGDTVTFCEVNSDLAETGRTIGPREITFVLPGECSLEFIRECSCCFTHT